MGTANIKVTISPTPASFGMKPAPERLEASIFVMSILDAFLLRAGDRRAGLQLLGRNGFQLVACAKEFPAHRLADRQHHSRRPNVVERALRCRHGWPALRQFARQTQHLPPETND